MNIAVAMKEIPEPAQVRIRDRKPVFEGAPLTLGPLEKNALEAGRALKEAAGGKLVIVSAGPHTFEDTVTEGLAMGADEAYLAQDDRLSGIESASSAELIASLVKKIGDVGLVLFGEGSGDNYSGQVGPRVAQILGMPLAAYATGIELDGSSVRVTCSLEDSFEVVELELPAVVTVMSGINEPRIPSVMEILKAGKKPKTTFTPDELGVKLLVPALVATRSNLAPVSDRKQVQVKTAEELLGVLRAGGVLGRD
ncbi:MAG: electron transfer flavoprotein beta subunit/FixA family protein [Spirochaetes bacterium]|nr:MAG: electron transfer flavoprotein beta subunit/FixA family protein [Spirochaetota bacterium]